MSYKALYAKLETMPALLHGPADAGDEKANRAFDPAKSPLIAWMRANLDQDWLHNLVLWNVFKDAGAIFWDPEAKAWRGRSVAEYEKVAAQKRAAKAAAQAAKDAAKAAKPKRKRGRARDVPTDILCDGVIGFEEKYKHSPTSMELLAEMKSEEFMAALNRKPISDSTFWKRHREAKTAKEGATYRLVAKPALRGTKQVEELTMPPPPATP